MRMGRKVSPAVPLHLATQPAHLCSAKAAVAAAAAATRGFAGCGKSEETSDCQHWGVEDEGLFKAKTMNKVDAEQPCDAA